MKLSEEIKDKIKEEYNNWFESQYGDKTLEERRELGAFYTPPSITIDMIEKMDYDSLEDKIILDPTCGSGNLLMGSILAGADPDKVFGNEYDAEMTKLCRERLAKYNVPKYNIHQGNALQKICLTQFDEDYDKNYRVDFIDDLSYAQDSLSVISKTDLW